MPLYSKKPRPSRSQKDKNILKAQQRAYREKVRKAIAEEIKPTEFRCLEEEDFVKRQYAPKTDSSTFNVEHPSIKGYTLRPVSTDWDCRKTSPMFFGYLSQNNSERFQVVLEFKIFGVKAVDISFDKITLCVYREIIGSDILYDGYVAKNFVTIEDIYDIEGEKMRRLCRKLSQRIEKHNVSNPNLSKRYEQNLKLLESKGAINVKVNVLVSCVHEIFKARGIKPAYRIGSADTESDCIDKKFLSPSIDLSFSVNKLEEKQCKVVENILRNAVNTGKLERNLSSNIGKQVLVTLTHLPYSLENTDIAENNDTPRGRKTEARKLTFHIAGSISDQKLHHSQNLRHVDDGSGPRYEACKYTHPVFYRRKFEHILSQASETSPVFWGQYNRQFVPKSSYQIDAQDVLTSHPSCAERAIISKETLLYAGKQKQKKLDAAVENPIFFGQESVKRQNLTDLNSKNTDSRDSSDDEDEELLLKLSTKNRPVKSSDSNGVDLFSLGDENVQKRHPSTFGYEVVAPIFSDCSKIIHPSCFGYKFSQNDNDLEPIPQLIELAHPACIGYRMVTQNFENVRNSSILINPMFFGYSLQKGPRYTMKKLINKKIANRLAALSRLIVNPNRGSKKICHVCFGKSLTGCPMCWTPSAISPINKLSENEDSEQSSKSEIKNALTSWKYISIYRSTQACFITFYIKTIPFGDVVRVTLENTKPIHHLYFKFRSNAKQVIANQEKLWILIPTTKGILCLDESRIKEDELNLAFNPGNLTFADFGFNDRSCEVCAIQVIDLHHPKVSDVMRSFVKQNVNMVKNLALNAKDADPFGEIVPPVIKDHIPKMDEAAARQRRLNRFGLGQGKKTSVSIKSRVESFKGKDGKVEELTLVSANKTAEAFDIINTVVDALDFEVIYTPDRVMENVPQDRLQILLVHEMKDIILVQEQNWQQQLKERRERIKQALKKRLEDKLQQRKEKRRKEKERLLRENKELGVENKKKNRKKRLPSPVTSLDLSKLRNS